MIPPESTLVKYDAPQQEGLKGSPSRKAKATGGLGKGKLAPIETKKDGAGDILNAVLPPRRWAEDGTSYVQFVSSTPATRLDVITLQEQLDLKLQQRQARGTGIDPVRRQLYSDTFDELIRQVAINEPTRGLLLMRIRDEIKMTIAAYQTLYESSVSFGMRKALQAEQGKMDLEKRIVVVEEEKKGLEAQVASLKAKCDEIEKKGAELRDVEKKKHEEAFQFQKRTNEQLKNQLESMLAPGKK